MPRVDMAFWDPKGEIYGVPTYPWRHAPEGLVTRRQLRDRNLCPGGHQPVAQLMAPAPGGKTMFAHLYDLALAAEKRTATPAVLGSIGKALTARRTCGTCSQVKTYSISKRLGECNDCAEQHGRLADAG